MEPDKIGNPNAILIANLLDTITELTDRINWYRDTIGKLQQRHDILAGENTELRIINREQRTGSTIQTLETVTNHLHQVWAWIQSPIGDDPEYDRLSDAFRELVETGTISRRPTITVDINTEHAEKEIRKNV